jgi:integrase
MAEQLIFDNACLSPSRLASVDTDASVGTDSSADTDASTDTDASADTDFVRAINCTMLAEAVRTYVSASLATATQRAYLADMAHFESWAGPIPATPERVAAYLAAHADSLSVATLVRRVAAISKTHQARSLPNPTRAELVKSTLNGIKRLKGVAQEQAKPLLKEDLFLMLDALGESTRDVRDRAVLLIGFAGGFRRSELVVLNTEDVQAERRGLIISLRRSKTDQLGEGRKIAVPYGRTRHCPVLAFEAWLARPAGTAGPLFRPVDRHGRIAVDLGHRPGARGSCRHRRDRLLGAQPEGRPRHQRRPGRGPRMEDPAADRPRLGRDARAVCARRGTVRGQRGLGAALRPAGAGEFRRPSRVHG